MAWSGSKLGFIMLLLFIITSNSLLISNEESIKNSLILNMHVEILKDELEHTHIYMLIWQTLAIAEPR